MSKKSYRDILTRYIQEHKVEDAILTDQVVQYAAEELGKDAAEVKKAVNVTMARLEKDGYVIRLAKGVYCKKVKTAFGFYMPNKDDLFCRQLLQDKDKIIGYETGLSALNRLGLVSQMPKKICIASNLHQKRVPEGIQVEVRKPPIAVNSENYRYLQILDTIRDLDRAPVDAAHPVDILKNAVRTLTLDTDTLILLARKHYSNKILIRTIDIILEEDMKLHEDRYAFLTIINLIHDVSGIRSDILEKDYYVSLLLRELAEKQSQLPAYFKGGTALYKAQKALGDFQKILI